VRRAATRRRSGPPARRGTHAPLPRVSRPARPRSRGQHRSRAGKRHGDRSDRAVKPECADRRRRSQPQPNQRRGDAERTCPARRDRVQSARASQHDHRRSLTLGQLPQADSRRRTDNDVAPDVGISQHSGPSLQPLVGDHAGPLLPARVKLTRMAHIGERQLETGGASILPSASASSPFGVPSWEMIKLAPLGQRTPSRPSIAQGARLAARNV
jgi:hypothetical protein